MGDKTTKEYFFSLLDDAASVVEDDALKEWHESWDYDITEGDNTGSYKEAVSSCHKCNACFSRRLYAEPVLNRNPRILFVLPSPEADTLLLPPSYSYFTKWIKAIDLRMEDISLSALIKCPVSVFSSEYADKCRDWLREEINYLKPSSIVLLGEKTACYMLRRSLPIDDMRQHSYRINGIRTFVTYTPGDLVSDREKRTPVWQDLLYISARIKEGDLKA